MNGMTKRVLLVGLVSLMASAAMAASDQLVPGSRLVLKVGSSGKEKLSFKSKGTFMLPAPGSADDPSHGGATLQLLNPNTNESFTFDLPKTHWSVTPAGTLYKYRDSTLLESGKVKIAMIGGRQLKVSGRKIGITLNEPSQGALAIVLTSGAFRYCARFDDGSVRVDRPGAFGAKNALPPSACPMPPTTTTVTTPTTTTTTTTTTLNPTTTTTTTVTFPATTTTATIPLPPLGHVVFTIGQGTTDCGGPGFSPPALAPFTGEVDNAMGAKIGDLGLGCLYFGGGDASALPPSSLPDGPTSILDVTGIAGLALTLSGSDGTGTADCTRGAGPGMHCLNGSLGTGLGACASDADCGGQTDACALDANCYFGPPVPVPVPGNPATSTCIVNALATDASGLADLLTQDTTLNATLAARLYLTGNAASPCPQCVSNTCSAGERQGLSCTGGVGSKNTTLECPPLSTRFVGLLTASLSPLSTGTTSVTDSSGQFCPDQAHPGAFGRFSPRTIRETGSPLLGGSNIFATTLAGVFCIQASGVPAIDALADLPGPAAVSVPGTVMVQIS